MMQSARLPSILCAVSLVGVSVSAGASAASAEMAADPGVSAFLDQHCMKCHNAEKAKGDLSLEGLQADFDDAKSRVIWSHVLEKIETGEMPPKSKPRPAVADLRATADWITAKVTEANAKVRATEGR